jgi:hypothetical protein
MANMTHRRSLRYREDNNAQRSTRGARRAALDARTKGRFLTFARQAAHSTEHRLSCRVRLRRAERAVRANVVGVRVDQLMRQACMRWSSAALGSGGFNPPR